MSLVAECPVCHEAFEADKPSGKGGIFCPMCPGPMKGVLHFREPKKALDLLDAFGARHEKDETEIYNLRRALSVLRYDSQAIATGLYDLERDGFIDYRQRATAAEAKVLHLAREVERCCPDCHRGYNSSGELTTHQVEKHGYKLFPDQDGKMSILDTEEKP